MWRTGTACAGRTRSGLAAKCVPCHLAIDSDGDLFRFGGGFERKRPQVHCEKPAALPHAVTLFKAVESS